MKLKLLVVTLLFFLFTGLTGCTGKGNSTVEPVSPYTNTVIVEGFKFTPNVVTINKGESVSWINHDSAAHTATGKIFDSGNLGNGATFKQSFVDAGTYEYICSYHRGMQGTIVVK